MWIEDLSQAGYDEISVEDRFFACDKTLESADVKVDRNERAKDTLATSGRRQRKRMPMGSEIVGSRFVNFLLSTTAQKAPLYQVGWRVAHVIVAYHMITESLN